MAPLSWATRSRSSRRSNWRSRTSPTSSMAEPTWACGVSPARCQMLPPPRFATRCSSGGVCTTTASSRCAVWSCRSSRRSRVATTTMAT
eukprot:3227251-Prymnesium_polylepis.1